MNAPKFLQGESLKRLLQGMTIGAIATMIVGFGWSGWMLGGSAKTMAENSAKSAVIAAIAPICVDQFQRSTDAATNIVELQKVDSWKQATFVEKGGWAVMPGSTSVTSGVSQACALMLSNLK